MRSSTKLALLTILFGALSGASSAALVAIINRAISRCRRRRAPQSSCPSWALPHEAGPQDGGPYRRLQLNRSFFLSTPHGSAGWLLGNQAPRPLFRGA